MLAYRIKYLYISKKDRIFLDFKKAHHFAVTNVLTTLILGGRIMTRNFFSFALLAFLFLTCKTTDTATKPVETTKKGGFTIGKLEWVIDQVEPSFWAKPLKISNKMFISFSLEYKGNFDLDLVENIVIDSPNDYYTIEGDDIQKVIEVDKDTINCKRLP